MKILWIFLVLILLVTGCTPPRPAGAEEARSDAPRNMTPDVSDDALQMLVDGNTAFAIDLYRQLQEKEGNLFFSPHSISVALTMTYAGARGETADQMAETLHFTLSQEELHAAFNALDLALRPEDDAEEEQEFVLNIANSLWVEETYTFRDEFLDLLARNYGAGLRLVSFKTAAEAARQAINTWVEEKTEGKIKDLIPKGGVNDLTRLVLANAIYFNAKWAHTFPENRTEDGTFATADGSEVTVPMMSWSEPEIIPYTQSDGYQAVELPYQGGDTSMVILVPDEGALADFESNLTGERLQNILAELETKGGVALTMPKFEYEAKASLADTLKLLGMPATFDPERANFSGMDGTRNLYITDIFHKAYVAVDEEGTEAAAATAAVFGITSMPQSDVELTIDRPFIYLIRDTETGAVLFLGRVVDPTAP
jgi:serpin B